jgi:hypothetical protein
LQTQQIVRRKGLIVSRLPRHLFAASCFVLAFLGLFGSVPALAQLNSNTQAISLTATLGESLTIAATPTSVSFTLVKGGTATGSAAVAITTTWILGPSRANLTLVGYFASTTAALTDGLSTPDLIPTSEVLGQVTTGSPTTFTAFTQSPGLGTAGAGLTLFTVALTSSNRTGTRTDNLNLEINLASQPQLPAGSYTGTLTLQAQAL